MYLRLFRNVILQFQKILRFCPLTAFWAGFLKNIQLLENQISEIIVSYYIPIPLKINGIKVNMSLFDLMQLIISDYKNVVLKDFYEGLD